MRFRVKRQEYCATECSARLPHVKQCKSGHDEDSNESTSGDDKENNQNIINTTVNGKHTVNSTDNNNNNSINWTAGRYRQDGSVSSTHSTSAAQAPVEATATATLRLTSTLTYASFSVNAVDGAFNFPPPPAQTSWIEARGAL
eukprot:Opistho-2@57901